MRPSSDPLATQLGEDAEPEDGVTNVDVMSYLLKPASDGFSEKEQTGSVAHLTLT